MFNVGDYFSWLRKNIKIADYLLYVVVGVLFFVTRLFRLDSFPVFTDEGIYIRWARIAWHDGNWRFISLTDGRQPLQTWATIPFLKFFSNNILLGGRLFAVASGLGALIGVIVLTYYLFGKRASFIASFLYILTPFFLFYDRMALVDSAVNAGFIWSLFFLILLARTLRLDVALIYGITAGVALLAKSSTKLFIGMGALTPLLFLKKKTKAIPSKILNFYVLYGVSAILALVLYNVQRLSPFFHFVDEKNNTFIMTFHEFLQTPFMRFPVNSYNIPYFIFSELSYVVGIFGLIGLFLLFKKDRNLALYFLAWLILPYLAIAFFAKVVYPRYLIFIAMTLLILASYFLSTIKKRSLFALFFLLFVLSISYFDYTIVVRQTAIPFPEVDRWQYITGISAGTGIKEIVQYARDHSTDKPAIIIAEGNFGVSGDMLEASLRPTDKIAIKGYWPLNEENLRENQKLVDNNNVFVVFAHRTEFPGIWPIEEIKIFKKPGGESQFSLFKLKGEEKKNRN